MVSNSELKIAIDPGHGGWDNGATWEGRLEKDDNLRLGLAVRDKLLSQGINVLMTRDTDVYVPLAERAAMANQADADLFISLHRNSYIEHTPMSNGVENFIYLTAPAETAGRAAKYVLDAVVDVGVQNNRGVQRGNYYVLRRTIMPAMLLEMGYIIDETDNRLFDENLDEYASAIAAGAMRYFDLDYRDDETLPPSGPECPACPSAEIIEAQRRLNERFGLDMRLSGVFDAATKKSAVMALQKALNSDFGAGLAVDGVAGPATLAAFPNVFPGQSGNLVFVLQALLALNGYAPGPIDGVFGSMTGTAMRLFQRDNYIIPDGIAGQATLRALLSIVN